MKIYHDKIQEVCSKMGITETELCKRAGISRVTYWTWKKQKKNPTPSSIKALAAELHVPVNYISELKSTYKESEAPFSELTDTWLSFANKADIDILKRQSEHIEKIKKEYIEFRQAIILINALMNSMQFILYIKDKNLKYLTANKAFLDNAGLLESFNVKGKEDSDFFSVNDAKENYIEDEQVLLTGSSIINKEIFIPGTRRKKWGLSTKQIIFDTYGKAAGIIGIIVDITEQKLLLKEISNYEFIFDSIPMAVEVVSYDDFKVIYANNQLEQVFGYSKEQVENMDFWLNNIVHPDDREEQLNHVKLGDFPENRQYRIIRPDGEIVTIKNSHIIKIYNDKKYRVVTNIVVQ